MIRLYSKHWMMLEILDLQQLALTFVSLHFPERLFLTMLGRGGRQAESFSRQTVDLHTYSHE